jgi:hypothetical protein
LRGEGELSQAIKSNRISDTHGEHIYALPYLRKKARVLSAGSYREIECRNENDARPQNSTIFLDMQAMRKFLSVNMKERER